MNKKQKTYVLLVVVVFVWGLIGYRVFVYLKPNKTPREITVQKKYIPLSQTKKTKTLTIKPYRDPFLGTIASPKKKQKPTSKQQVEFPKISYNGRIQSNRFSLYIVNINNHQEVMRIGQTIRKVTLLSANKKQLIIRFKKSTKKILLNQ